MSNFSQNLRDAGKGLLETTAILAAGFFLADVIDSYIRPRNGDKLADLSAAEVRVDVDYREQFLAETGIDPIDLAMIENGGG